MDIYSEILKKAQNGDKMWAVLIDPDKTSIEQLGQLIRQINYSSCNFIFVGGSQLFKADFDDYVKKMRLLTKKKIIIFPGDNSQISSSADAILLLSLISGRNPDLLIGKHIQSSYVLKKSGISILPTGYILVDGGIATSVQYISNTTPIPADKFHIAASTALAGEQLGLKFTYLDAGSGALHPVSMKMISSVRKEISCPIIVGGGIKSYEQLENAWLSGADIVVVGNAIEKNSALINQLDSRIKCN